MSEAQLYPQSPQNVPEDLTRAKSSYKRQIWLAVAGLLGFIFFYLVLTACFAYITYSHAIKIQTGGLDIIELVITLMSGLLTVFLLKSLFVVRKSGSAGGLEITEKDQPNLFAFLHKLADEVGAPKPHRVFLTPDVNAAVFYDLSLFNLIFPSKKNLVIGLGLVNVLNLGELKAVLAHEFGHFAQGSMAVGRWVYIAQQIISHVVAVRDWLDSIVKLISRIDLRVAWIGWLLALIIWSIRSLMDTLFRLVIIAERALSREMEFNADLVAVSVTGSDALVNALHKLQAADEAWQTAVDVAGNEASKGKKITDLFHAQKTAISAIGEILDDEDYGTTPAVKTGDPKSHRVFTKQTAMPPQMWSTHPANQDREENAKGVYVAANIDERSAWDIFSEPDSLRESISLSFYRSDNVNTLESIRAEEAVSNRFDRASYAPQYRGTYLSRSPVRGFESVDELINTSDIEAITTETFANLYPESISTKLESARNLDAERRTLSALLSGDLKPSGGVIRHRGEELKKSEIPQAIEQVAKERTDVSKQLRLHDANCRVAHQIAANQLGNGWDTYLKSLLALLHCAEHLSAITSNEQALLVNTWQVITADGKIGYFEKRRILNVCKQTQEVMRSVSSYMRQIELPQPIIDEIGIKNWSEECPLFQIADVDKKNWGDWCQAASNTMTSMTNALNYVRSCALEELINGESKVAANFRNSNELEEAPAPGKCPSGYPVLMPGQEHVLQKKLDLWNRFQLAQGTFPTALRLVISLGIVGGVVYVGLFGI